MVPIRGCSVGSIAIVRDVPSASGLPGQGSARAPAMPANSTKVPTNAGKARISFAIPSDYAWSDSANGPQRRSNVGRHRIRPQINAALTVRALLRLGAGARTVHGESAASMAEPWPEGDVWAVAWVAWAGT